MKFILEIWFAILFLSYLISVEYCLSIHDFSIKLRDGYYKIHIYYCGSYMTIFSSWYSEYSNLLL